jgi:indolepyruvate ferredoxin oxidoreductase alpha subunit
MAHHLTKLGRHQRHRLNTWPAVEQVLARSQLATARHARHCERGVIAVGSAARLVERSDVCRLVVESSWPIPTEVWEFLLTHNSVVVAEEPAPFLERELHVSGGSCATRLRGRDSGHLPPEGWLVDADISASLGVGRPAGSWTTFATKTFDQVTPHQYEVLFRAVGRLHADGVFVSADVGSSVKLCYPPYNGADVALCLGSAISVAGGSARHEGPSIAVVGDYGLMHSGIEALIDVVRRHLPVLVLLLANGVSAQTGNQPTSVSPFGDGAPPLRLRPLLEAIGVAHVEQWDIADRHADETLETLRSLLGGSLPAVALVTAGPGIA